MVRTTFETHLYECEGRIFHQNDGCPTVLRPSGPISRIVMDFWVKELREIEEKSRELIRLNPVMFEPLEVLLLQKYVDDVMYAGNKFRKGTKWDPTAKALIWDPEQEKIDRTSDENDEKRSMRIVAQMSSDILYCLEFT